MDNRLKKLDNLNYSKKDNRVGSGKQTATPECVSWEIGMFLGILGKEKILGNGQILGNFAFANFGVGPGSHTHRYLSWLSSAL